MSSIMQEANDLMRQLQKLNKELNPVKTALSTLKKREQENPNSQAAAVSLTRIGIRVYDVHKKYKHAMERIDQLLEEGLPNFLLKTPVLTVLRTHPKQLDEDIAKTYQIRSPDEKTKSNSTSPKSSLNHTQFQPKNGVVESSSPSLLDNVCPPHLPYAVPPEYYKHYQDKLLMRVEMVNYLISTNRTRLAKHVAESYGLPLLWFPLLYVDTFLASCADRDGGTESGARGGGIASIAAQKSALSPSITPSTVPSHPEIVNNNHVAGDMPPYSPLPASILSVSLATSSGISSYLCPRHRSEDHENYTVLNESSFTTPQRPSQPCIESPPLPPSHICCHNSGGGGSRETSVLPDLVARVVGAAFFLKDEYFDRMVLERLVQTRDFSGACSSADSASLADAVALFNKQPSSVAALVTTLMNGAVADPTPPPASSPEVATDPGAVARYCKAVLCRARGLARGHLCTQSGSLQFDHAMMGVVEELLAGALACDGRRKRAHGGGDPPPSPPARPPSHAPPPRLMPDELLEAENVWGGDIAFIKRPTRYYCARSATCMDGGEEDAAPVALPSGRIVCEDELHKSTRNGGEGKEDKKFTTATAASVRRRDGLLFLPFDAHLNPGTVRRIFIT